jgi:hypothetical protein
MSIVAQRIVIALVHVLPRWGMIGAGIAWCVGQSSLATVVLLTQLRRVFRLDGRWALEGVR